VTKKRQQREVTNRRLTSAMLSICAWGLFLKLSNCLPTELQHRYISLIIFGAFRPVLDPDFVGPKNLASPISRGKNFGGVFFAKKVGNGNSASPAQGGLRHTPAMDFLCLYHFLVLVPHYLSHTAPVPER